MTSEVCKLHFAEAHRLALISSIEVVLMSMGNTKYNLVTSKLHSYNLTMRDSYKNVDYLKIVLKEVYGVEYPYIINEIKVQLGEELIKEKDVAEFFKAMEE